MNNYQKHAMNEFRAANWVDENGRFHDETQENICNHIMKLLEVFADEGHSGTSAPYTISVFQKLAKFEPISPLTGEDWEWNNINDDRTGNVSVYQNRRCTAVFKQSDRFDGKPYYLNGKVFWEWYSRPLEQNEEGYPGFTTYKTYYTSKDSFVTIEFPYTPKTEYVFVPTDDFPNEVL